jgi:pSer/pThr/pTyr-binding forkhead associated (FHA) protein
MTETRYFIKKVTTGQQTPIASLMSIGRSEDSALRLIEGQPSRHHAQITLDPGGAFIEDLGSTNGTFVNGRRLDARVRQKLSGGDSVRFDVEEFTFVAPPPPATGGDAEKTIFRPPSDEKTVFRPPPADSRPAGAEKPAAEAKSPSAERVPAEPRPAAAQRPPEKPEGPPADSAARAAPRASEAPGARDLPRSFAEPKGDATVFVPQRRPAQGGGSAVPVPAHAAGDPPYFWVESGGGAGKKIELKSEAGAKTWRIGSGADCDVRFDEPGVSGSHAKLMHDNATWLVTDDLSVNGTYVNDKKTLKSYLANGDRVRFGPVECRFFVPAPGARTGGAGGSPWRKYGLIAAIAFALTLALLLIVSRFMK